MMREFDGKWRGEGAFLVCKVALRLSVDWFKSVTLYDPDNSALLDSHLT
jgi:hypothetical protein